MEDSGVFSMFLFVTVFGLSFVSISLVVVFPCLLYGVLIVFGIRFGFAVLTSAVSMDENEFEESLSSLHVGITGKFPWLVIVCIAAFIGFMSSGPHVGGGFRQKGYLGVVPCPSIRRVEQEERLKFVDT
jgi:hypothetical protein